MNEDPSNPFPEPVVLPLDDCLDLHTFNPKDLPHLLDDYLAECSAAGFEEVRIIHGRGRGILRDRLHSLLKSHPLATGYHLDNPGATVVRLRKKNV